jgi:hypothetical protein
MHCNASKTGWAGWCRENLVHVCAWSFTAAVVFGSLACGSCAHTPAGLEREQILFDASSNAMVAVRQATPYAPPPCNSVLEGVLAVGGALLALWATHLQRSLKEVRTTQLPPASANGTGATPPSRPASG